MSGTVGNFGPSLASISRQNVVFVASHTLGSVGSGAIFNTVSDDSDGLAALFIFKEELGLTLGADIGPFIEELVGVDKTVGNNRLHKLSADFGGLILIVTRGTGGASAEVGVSCAIGCSDLLTLINIMYFSE